MATPIIETVGTLASLLKITDHEGVVHRIPKNSVCNIINSSTATHNRLEICHPKDTVILLYPTHDDVVTALVTIDAEY